ncbi:MAG: 2-C-methyl-D-erythritol 2,4-cyclodiphosphate synthase [Bacillota bacterium]|uniref:2-C-methyl-D-erythritol 2,4-cyclodiphosphate synthase n=1 Tax=Thermanaerosceptrum fracticalcis TaxID=1712410 RepID=A0A7G6E5R7_THEFR|nr:2-C-methyl-D-erythritol 2,4-cyclodiphosphate synthase [Thermanaerosceptrum fracticalcis]QNB47421.1 2-C-methyl-D-erythritol 2,4-cyclodiphosphate synthase [Thermanaerosceptrum fracticalcis]
MRIGFGYDVHALVEGRKLIIGGIQIPHEKGLQGHSDADVLLHAVMDALLGAAALGDIGQHFPDRDERFKDIDSGLLLTEVARLLHSKGYTCHNLDCTVVAQSPQIAPYREEMRKRIAQLLGIPLEQVSIKATTTEGLGFTGRKEGIAAYAVCTITSIG